MTQPEMACLQSAEIALWSWWGSCRERVAAGCLRVLWWVGSALRKHFLQPPLKKKVWKNMLFYASLLKSMYVLEFLLLLWMLFWYSLHSVANNHQEMLKSQQSPCFLCVLLWNTEIMAVCLPCWFLWCIGLATLSPIYDNALRKKPFRSNKWLW